MSAIVVGSGVIGASIAYHLQSRGMPVTLVDRALPASKPSASWASAGGLRSQGRHASEHAITRAAADRWSRLAEELDADLEIRLQGHLHVAETEAEAAVIDARIATDRAAGLPIERLDDVDIRGVVPALTKRARLGAFTPGDGQAHPGRTARAFAEAASRAGATCRFGTDARPSMTGPRVTGVVLADGSRIAADHVVLATGAWSVRMLADLGMALPLRWRGLQMLLSEIAPPLLGPTVTAVGRNLSLKQSPSGQLMIGGRWFGRPVSDAPNVAPIDAHVARQWSSAVAVLPALASLTLAHVWAGAEAQTPDSLPLIGPAGPAGLYLATGFSNHGFQVSPEIGRLVARELDGVLEPSLEPFRPGRFPSNADAAADFQAEPILL